MKQYVNAVFQHTVDDISLQETKKENLSMKNETHDNIDN